MALRKNLMLSLSKHAPSLSRSPRAPSKAIALRYGEEDDGLSRRRESQCWPR